jgi:uncharacterized protein
MYICFILFLFILLYIPANAQQKSTGVTEEYEMKTYYFVLLTKGAQRDQDSATVAKLQKGHMDNIGRLYQEGKIDIAGPFLEGDDWRGIFIFNADSKEEVDSLLKTDPAIKAGRLDYKILKWMGGKGSSLR